MEIFASTVLQDALGDSALCLAQMETLEEVKGARVCGLRRRYRSASASPREPVAFARVESRLYGP